MAKLDGAQSFDEPGMLQFLGGLDQIHLVAIHKSRPDVHGKYFGTHAESAVEWAKAKNGTGFGIYWTVNRVPENFDKKPKKSDIVAARYCHVDIDPPKGDGGFSKAATLETLDNLRCPPTFVIDSGNGLQAFFALDGDARNLDAIEGINQQIRTMFSADACHNIDRLMRVPGAVNWPSPTKEARGRSPAIARVLSENTGQVYEPAELSASFPPAEHGRESEVARGHVSITGVEYTTCDDLGLTQFNRVRVAIERPKGADRSANVLHAACECVREGYDDTRIAGLLLNPENAVSAHLLDQGDPLRACMRVIGRARGEEPDALVVPDEVREAVISKPISTAVIENSQSDEKVSDFDWYATLTAPMKLMVDTVNTYAPSPRPELALGSAIAAFATAMGRRYQTPSGLLSNIYLVGLSPSGSGKDLPVNAPAQALIAAGTMGEKMVGGDIVSARGIMSALETSPTLFIPADEVGKLIQAIQDPRGTLKDAVTVLLKMYSASQNAFKGAMYANQKDRPTVMIHRPCLGFYGVSNPLAFWDKLTHASVSDGLLPRFILLPDNMPDTPPPRRLRRCVYPDALIEALRSCMQGADEYSPFPMGDGCDTPPKPYQVEFADSAADDREYQMRLDQHEWAKHVEPEMQPFVRRAAENAMKLALVRAVSDNPTKPALRFADLDWGWGLSARSVQEFMVQTEGNISENEIEAQSKKVVASIRDCPDEWATTSWIGRKCGGISGPARSQILDDLIDRQVIVKEVEKGTGRPKVMYKMA